MTLIKCKQIQEENCSKNIWVKHADVQNEVTTNLHCEVKLTCLSIFLSLSSSLPQAEAVRRVMSELNLTVVEMGAEEGGSGGATLEGSDVLFTGREFFVGISSHTNRRGAEVLADTFRVRDTEGKRWIDKRTKESTNV